MRMKKVALMVLMLILMQYGLLAVQDQGLDQFDDEGSVEKVNILPPEIPDSGSKANEAASDTSLARVALQESSNNLFSVNLLLNDFISKQLIKETHVLVEITSQSEKPIKTLKYVDNSGILSLKLKSGEYRLLLKIDSIDTPGTDYLYDTDLTIESDFEENIYVLPAGTLKIRVTSNQEVIPGAKVSLQRCSGTNQAVPEKITDSSGIVVFEYLPKGTCLVSATSEDRSGELEINIAKGKFNSFDLELSQTVKSGFSVWVYIVLVLIFVFIFTLGIIYGSKRNKDKDNADDNDKDKGSIKEKEDIAEKEIDTKKENTVSSNSRAETIIKTLSDKEKQIVEFLQENQGAYQNKIMYATNIPKTSLVRLFQSLEKKSIITLKKVGKVKRIYLTDWFLGNDEKDQNDL